MYPFVGALAGLSIVLGLPVHYGSWEDAVSTLIGAMMFGFLIGVIANGVQKRS